MNGDVANPIPKLYRRAPLKTALLNQENHLERSTPELVWCTIDLEVLDIIRMLRTGAPFSLKLMMKINRRNFEDAPHGRAFFEDTQMIKTQKKKKNRESLERERNFSSKQNLEF